jgi:hypothetical protein
MSTGTFVTAIDCMDGRTKRSVIRFLKKKFRVDYVDVITEPGPDKILAEATDLAVVENTKKRLDISVNKHHSKVIAVIAHEECAGNPVEKEKHLAHSRQARKTVEGFGFDAEVISIWVPADCWRKKGIVARFFTNIAEAILDLIDWMEGLSQNRESIEEIK